MVVLDGDSSATQLWPQCAIATALLDSELSILRALKDLAGPPQGYVACELAAGHGGRHTAFVVAAHGGDRWWWIRWESQERELIDLELCDHTDEQGRDDCLLPAGHPGVHSFQM